MRKKNTNEQLHTQPQFRLKPVYAAVLLAFTVQNVQANPIDATVVSGQASFATAGSTLTVTNTPGAIINWQGFSISANEITRFAQQSASSAVLNRVISNNASSILGTLQSNGRVFLINPNGIVFGAGSTVDVAGLVASTLNLSNADFLAGRYSFTEVPGAQKISNAGNISSQDGGQIYLIAPDVENTGVITAPNGEILLAAGHSVDLVNTNSPNLIVNITAPAGDATNVGQLIASSGSLGLFGTVVRNSGQVSADSATLQGGKIVFRASQRVEAGGTISAQGTGGGNIAVLADMQSGTVNVTGTLDASAPNSGDGGFIDTSAAHVQVADTARITTAAVNGKSGMWLLDPYDFTIAATGGGDITGAALSAALGAGAVTIQTVSPLCTGAACGTGNPAGNGDIFVNDTVSWSSNTLTLTAERDININAVMTASGASVLALNPSTAVLDGAVKMGFNADGSFKGRVDFGARSGTGILTGYTVINDVTALQNMSSGLSGSYAIGSNIDASATSGWNGGLGFAPVGTGPAGPPYAYFTGRFDGLGHTITGLTINRPAEDYVGLFGSTFPATIRNVGLENGSVSGRDFVGGLVGRSWSSVYDKISNSYNTGSVSGSGAGGYGGVGGLVGYSSSAITNSYNTGIISGGIIVGGLVGIVKAGGSITSSYNTGTVTGTGGEVGGLAGEGGAISNSYNSGGVNGNDSVGGLVGYQTGGITNSYNSGSVGGSINVGGLSGWHYGGAITNSYNAGSVSGSTNVGGLVGNRWSGSGAITNSYWDNIQFSGNCAGSGSIAGCAGKTTAEMKQIATFSSWSIANTGGSSAVWRIYEGHTAPLLTSFMTGLTLAGVPDITLTYNSSAQSGATFMLIPNVLGAAATGTNAGFYNGYYSTQQGYDITGGNLTINAASLSAISLSGTRAYDGTVDVAAGIFTLSGLVIGEDLTLTGVGTIADKNVGINKPVTLGSLALGNGTIGLASNYTFTGGTQTATITQLASVDYTGVSGNWSNAANWAGGALPDGSNVLAVTIPSGVTVTYDSGVVGTTTLNSLTSLGNFTMAAGTLSTSGNISTAGYQQTGGTLNVGGNMTVTQSFAKASGATGSLVLTGGSSTISITQSTGDLVFYNNQPLRLGAITASAGNVLIDTVGAITTTGTVSVAGTFTLSGGTWNQVSATLPGFTVNDFRITGGTFIRAIGGVGSIADPYQLADIYGVQGMGSAGMLGNAYALANDINATGTVNWNTGAGFVPVGTDYYFAFTGQFDGQNHTISNLTINRTGNSYIGLFGYMSGGSVSNVGLVNASVTGVSYVGGLVGYDSGEGGGTITNSYSTGSVTGTGDNTGGLVGYNSSGIITNSYSTSSVSGCCYYVGGLMGRNWYGTISNSYSTGSVTGGNYYVGGLVGDNSGTISNTYSTGSVSGGNYYAGTGGGLVGGNSGTITNSYWDTLTSGWTTSAGGTGLTTALMTTMASFTGWNIANTGGSTTADWRIYDGFTAPLLRSFLKPLTITAAPVSAVYTGMAYSGGLVSPVYSPPSPDPTTHLFGNAYVNAVNVGTYAPARYSDQQGYDISYVNGILTINPSMLTLLSVTANNASKTYGTTLAFAGTEFTPVGLLGGNTISGVTLTSAGAVATANAGAYAIVITPGSEVFSVGSASNYTITYVNGTLTVTPATLTYTATAANRLYGATDPAFSGSVTGFVLSDTLATTTTGTTSFTTDALSTINVGSYAITGSGLTATNVNYVFTQAAGNSTAFTISPAILTYTANAASRTYGAADPAFSGSVGGFVLGENLATATTGTATFSAGALNTSNVGSYAITGSGLTANFGNYTFAQAAGNSTAFTISPAILTYTANAASRTYGAADPAFSGSVGGFVLGENLATATTGTATFSTGALNTSNVGSYAITGSGLTANFGNYTFAQAAGNSTAFTINPATLSLLSVTANNASKTYGTTLAFNGSEFAPVGLLGGDTISGVTLASAGAVDTANAGTYAITPSNAVFSIGSASNYTLSYVDGQLTVTARPISVTADAISRVYGDADPALTYAVGGLGLVAWDTNATAFTGALARAAGENVAASPYAISQGTLTASNYTITFAGNIFTITPAPLSVYAYPANKIISTPDPLLGYIVAGLKLGDTAAATLNAGSQARDAGEAVGNYQINQGSLALASTNYTMNYFPANFTILAPTVVDEIANAILLLGTPETGSAQSTSSADEEEKRKAEEAVVVAETPESGDTTKPPLPVCPGS